MKREWKSRRWKWVARGAIVGAVVSLVMYVGSGWFTGSVRWGVASPSSLYSAKESWEIRLLQGRVRFMRVLPNDGRVKSAAESLKSDRAFIQELELSLLGEKVQLDEMRSRGVEDRSFIDSQMKSYLHSEEFLVRQRAYLEKQERKVEAGRAVSVYWEGGWQHGAVPWALFFTEPRTALFLNWDNNSYFSYASAPLAPMVLGFGGLSWVAFALGRRVADGHCGTCGYDLRASPGRCPECGEEGEC